MRTSEFSKKGFFGQKYAIGIVIVYEGPEQFSQELAEAVAAVTPWRAKYGKGAKDVLLTIMAEKEQIKPCAAALRGHAGIREATKGVRTNVQFPAMSGTKLLLEFRLK